MRVVFLAPIYPPEMHEYTRGLAEVGAQVYGVGDTPREALPARVKPLPRTTTSRSRASWTRTT